LLRRLGIKVEILGIDGLAFELRNFLAEERLQMNFQAGVSRHLVPLAAFFVQPQPPALAVTLH
jgi:hypothetical protein